MRPRSPGSRLPRTHTLPYTFCGDEAGPDRIAGLLELDDQVGAEDPELLESVQRGMRSGAFEHGRLMLRGEELIAELKHLAAGPD